MDAVLEIPRMRGDAFFVWTSFLIVAVLLELDIQLSLRRHRQVRFRPRTSLAAGGADPCETRHRGDPR